MKAAFKRASDDVIIRDIDIPVPGYGEVLINVISCGVCGGDIGTSPEYKQFGHEVAGEVVKCGDGVLRLKPGDRVVVESGGFCGVCNVCRDGHPELCRNPVIGTYKGFAEYVTVNQKNCVLLPDGFPYKHAAIIEPLGVAIDLVKVADIQMGDHVLILGAGSIGLMALQLARRAGASRIWSAVHSRSTRKAELAMQFGAEDVIYTDKQSICDYSFPRGKVNKVLITAPPQTIPDALKVLDYCGTAAFIGFGGDGNITLDAHYFHRNKLQLKGAFSLPGMYFPLAMEAIASGMVDADSIISHTAPLDDIANLMYIAGCRRDIAVKCVMLNE